MQLHTNANVDDSFQSDKESLNPEGGSSEFKLYWDDIIDAKLMNELSVRGLSHVPIQNGGVIASIKLVQFMAEAKTVGQLIEEGHLALPKEKIVQTKNSDFVLSLFAPEKTGNQEPLLAS